MKKDSLPVAQSPVAQSPVAQSPVVNRVPVPADNASEIEKIAYLNANFGEPLADDLLAAAKSGGIPNVLKGFLKREFDVVVPIYEEVGNGEFKRSEGRAIESGGWLADDYHLNMFHHFSHNEGKFGWKSGNYYPSLQGVLSANDGGISYGHDKIKEALKIAVREENMDFLKAFLEPIKGKDYGGKALDSYALLKFNDSHKGTLNELVEDAIKADKVRILDLFLKNGQLCEDLGKKQDLTLLVEKYGQEHPAAIARLLEVPEVKKDVEEAIRKGSALQNAISGLAQQGQEPVVAKLLPHEKAR